MTLSGLTVFVSGGSRGIGKAIALKIAKDGANVVIAAKTAEPHPKLPGTIYTSCEEVEKAGGKGLACVMDLRDEGQVKKAVTDAVKKFGGIDILINNASAISLTTTENTEMKRYDLMHNINTRGTFLLTKECLPFLKKSKHAHVLNLSPPLSMKSHWFAPHVAYTMAKYGMSMCALGWAEEFRPYNIGVNALWPRTAIGTAAIEMLSGKESVVYTRKSDIMADAAYEILTQNPTKCTGNFFIDDDVLKQAGQTDFDKYLHDPANKDKLMPDFFVDGNEDSPLSPRNKPAPTATTTSSQPAPSAPEDTGKVAQLFSVIAKTISADTVGKTGAIFQFVVTGDEAGKWYIDLKNGEGACGKGDAPSKPDATLTMDSKNFFNMFNGKLKPTTAYMLGKLKIGGNLQKALKLEKLMSSLKSKL